MCPDNPKPRCKVDTRIYALNILSTQASFGQAEDILRELIRLVKNNSRKIPELEKPVDVTSALRENAKVSEPNWG